MKALPHWMSVAIAASPLAWLSPPLRAAAEGRMSVHMLLQLPLLFLAGWCFAAFLPRSVLAAWSRIDRMGLAGTAFATAIAAFWMIPAALDLALLVPGVDVLKHAGWILSGLLVGAGWRRITPEVLLFFVGGMVWMLATAGFLYFDAVSRLCVNYRFDEQRVTGAGLIVWAVLLPFLSVPGSIQAGQFNASRG